MGKRAPKALEAPDPYATASAQGSWNTFTSQQQQAMNMVGQNTPYGSLAYAQTGSTTLTDPSGKQVTVPQYTANVNLSPSQQAIFDQTQQAEGNLAQLANTQSSWLKDYLSKGIDLSGAPALQSQIGNGYRTSVGDGYATSYAGAGDFSADRQRVEDSILQRLAPQQAADENKLRTTLINQGIRPGTAAWNSEYARLQSGVNDARLGAIGLGGQEQSRLVGLARDAASFGNASILDRFNAENGAALTSANFGNAARSQALGEAYAERNQPLNELLGVLSGAQIQNPTSAFAQTPQSAVAGVDYTGLVNQQYQGKLAQYNADVQSRNAMMGGLFGLGGALLGAGGTAGGFGKLFSGMF